MARFRSFLTQSPAIVIASIALVFSLGGGAGYAASSASGSAASSSIAWHKITLINGWKPLSTAKKTPFGIPAYAVSNGVVYLSGFLHNASTTANTEIGVLPKAARPKHVLEVSLFSSAADFPAGMTIYPDGRMYLTSSNPNYYYQSSLAGVSYPFGS